MNAEALCGKVLGTSTLQKIIGRGGMGAVYLAQQSRPKRQVAIKVLLPLAALQPNQHKAFLERFRRETDAAAALQHPNIMPVHEYGEREGLAYLVMPYVSGGTLRDELDTEGKLPLTRIAIYLEQIASALDFAHAQGVIHRDIKPANIMMTPEKRLLLTDFGLVKIITDGQKDQNPLSEAGMPMGTPDYMAPEQVVGREIDARADIYSLGVLAYHMLTGTVPFSGSSPMKVAMHHLHTPPPPLRPLRPDLPPEAEKAIVRALAKRPADRYDSAQALATAFRTALEEAGVQVAHVPVTPADERSGNNRPRGLFDPLWRNTIKARTTDTKLPTQAKTVAKQDQQPASLAGPQKASLKFDGENIVVRNKMTLSSLSYIMTQNNIPTVKAEKDGPSAVLPSAEALLPLENTVLSERTGETDGIAQIPADAYKDRKKTVAPVTHTPLPDIHEIDKQQGPANVINNPWNSTPQDGDQQKPGNKSLLSPHFRNGHNTGLRNWQQEPQAPSTPQGQAPTQSLFNAPPFPDQGGMQPPVPQQGNSYPTPNAPVPQQDFAAPQYSFGNPQPWNAQENTKPWSYTVEPSQQTANNVPTQMGNTTRQLGTPTGMLPDPGTTGALTGPIGEYSGNTGMLKLNHAVKVVRVPVAGQPGQYKTGILPIQQGTGALPPPQGQPQAPTTGTKKNKKKVALVLFVVVLILFSSGIYLLTRSANTGPARTQTNSTTDKNTNLNKPATATAGANATATADVKSTKYYDPMTTNINNLPVSSKGDFVYFFKEDGYHIKQNSDAYLPYVLLGSLELPKKYAYSMALKNVGGDTDSSYNFSGLILRFKQDKKHITFYFFRIVYEKDEVKYMFHKYDSNKESPWEDGQLFEKKAGKEFKGLKESNAVKIIVEGSKFTFFVNGTKIGDKTDSSYKDGILGMAVNNKDNETAFRDFRINELP